MYPEWLTLGGMFIGWGICLLVTCGFYARYKSDELADALEWMYSTVGKGLVWGLIGHQIIQLFK